MAELGYSAVGQTFGVSAALDGNSRVALVPATHSFLAPETIPSPPYEEVAGDYVETQAPPIDKPSWKSLSGMIIILVFTMSLLSLFACLGRADFGFPFLLFGYYVWCVSSSYEPSTTDEDMMYAKTTSLVQADRKTYRCVKLWLQSFALMTLIDALWISIAFGAWTCVYERNSDSEDTLACFNPDKHQTLIQSHGLHLFTLWISVVNFVLKVN